jgi:hypothetical protein
MHIDRRSLLGGLFGLAALPRCGHAEADPLAEAAVGAVRDGGGAFRVAGLGTDLHEKLGLTAPLRLHAVVPNPRGGVVAVARRPGDLAFVLPPGADAPATVLHAAEGRRFAGHGVFLDGGRTFAIAEIEVLSGEGRLAFLDVDAGWMRRVEFATAGIGPHEVVAAGKSLVVANGAREPAPEPGIAALAESEAESTVSFLDPATGALRAQFAAPAGFEGLSLRHMAVARDVTVLVAAQEQDFGIAERPLLFSATERGMAAIDGDESTWRALGGYIGQVAVDASGTVAAVSSPRGGVVVAFDLARRRTIGRVEMPDVCGLSGDGRAGGFIATTGLGTVARLLATEDRLVLLESRATPLAWDNHLFARR